MKITRKQLRQIIKEERSNLREGRMAELEAQLVEDIVMLLVENGAVNSNQRGYDTGSYDDDVYQEALDYLRNAIIPTLSSLASRGAYDRK